MLPDRIFILSCYFVCCKHPRSVPGIAKIRRKIQKAWKNYMDLKSLKTQQKIMTENTSCETSALLLLET